MLHNYQHSLALTEVLFSFESKTLWKFDHLYLILNVVMIRWLRGCCTWMVVLDRYSFWILRWARPTAGYPGAFPRTRRTLQARSLDLNTVLQPAITGMAFSLTMTPLIDNHFCVLSSSHTYKALSFCSRKGYS